MNNIQNVYEIYIKDQPFFPVADSTIPYRFSNISLFSTGNAEQAIYTANLIASYFKESDIPNLVVTDATSCIGGNTWAFALIFKHVNAIELEKIHSDMLKHNMSLMKLNDKITIYNTNYLDIYSNIEQDIIFLDPPWGGVDYITKPQVGLFSSDNMFFIDLPSLISNPLFAKNTTMIIIKVPKNYSTYNIKKKRFNYKRIYYLKTKQGDVLYKLIILSKIPNKHYIKTPYFTKIGYKYIKFNSKITNH